MLKASALALLRLRRAALSRQDLQAKRADLPAVAEPLPHSPESKCV
jgi:hypothetical protein